MALQCTTLYVLEDEIKRKTIDFILLGRIVKFFQSFSILSSTYIIVVMAIDRCIAIVTPLRAGEIRVSSLNDTNRRYNRG